jgi:hypothetical protein
VNNNLEMVDIKSKYDEKEEDKSEITLIQDFYENNNNSERDNGTDIVNINNTSMSSMSISTEIISNQHDELFEIIDYSEKECSNGMFNNDCIREEYEEDWNLVEK